MFTDHLSALEKLSLLDLLVRVASSDGQVGAGERALLEEASRNLSLGEIDLDAHIAKAASLNADEIRRLVAMFESKPAKAIALAELIHLAHVDGVYDENEREAVRIIASWMGIDDEHVGRIEGWVALGQAWHTTGRQVLGLDN